MKVVLSIDISPKLLGILNEEELQDKLKSRCLTLVKSYEKKWKENGELYSKEEVDDQTEVNWSEMIDEGFEEAKKSIEVRVWGSA